jgi:hypothetical protein
VNDRLVETEFVFDRHAATDLSVAYAILVPERRVRIAGSGQEASLCHTSAAIYARVSSARQKKDDTIASQTAALRVHAEQLGLSCARRGCLKMRATGARRWCVRGWSGCVIWSPGSAWMWCCAIPRTGWPASSPTRRC